MTVMLQTSASEFNAPASWEHGFDGSGSCSPMVNAKGLLILQALGRSKSASKISRAKTRVLTAVRTSPLAKTYL